MSSPTWTFRKGRKNESRWPAMATFPDSPGTAVFSIWPRPNWSVWASEPCNTTADTPRRGMDSSASGVPGASLLDCAFDEPDGGVDVDGDSVLRDVVPSVSRADC